MDENKLIQDVTNESKKIKNEKFDIGYIQSPHYSNRNGSKIDTIIVHYTAANRINSTINWFKDSRSNVSAHYIIGRDGRIVQMVQHEKKAWHAGKSIFQGRRNINKFSIGIEIVGTLDSGYTDKQYKACVHICSVLIDEFDIPVENIVGHSDVSGENAVKLGIRTKSNMKIDPGPKWDWEKFHMYLAEESDKSIVEEEPEPENDKVNNKNLYSPDNLMESGRDEEPNNLILKLILRFIEKIFK